MALMRRGSLFAGALFAGLLFGPGQVEVPQTGGGSSRHQTQSYHAPFNIQTDDEEIVLILTLMVELL